MELDEVKNKSVEELADMIYKVREVEKMNPDQYKAALEYLAKKGKLISSFDDLRSYREERNDLEREVDDNKEVEA